METETVQETNVEVTESQKNIEQIALIWKYVKVATYTILNIIESVSIPLAVAFSGVFALYAYGHAIGKMDIATLEFIKEDVSILIYSIYGVLIGAVWGATKKVFGWDD